MNHSELERIRTKGLFVTINKKKTYPLKGIFCVVRIDDRYVKERFSTYQSLSPLKYFKITKEKMQEYLDMYYSGKMCTL